MTKNSTGYTLEDFKIGAIVKSTQNPAWDFTVTGKTDYSVIVKNSLNLNGTEYRVNPGILHPKDGPQTKPKTPVMDFEYNNKEAIYKEMLLNGVKNIQYSAKSIPIEDESGWLSFIEYEDTPSDVIKLMEKMNVRIRPQSKQPKQPKVTTEFVCGQTYQFEVQFIENPDSSVNADVIDVWRRNEIDSCFAGNTYKE